MVNLLHIFQILGRSARVLKRPIIIPIEDNADLRFISGSKCAVTEAFQFCTKLCHLTENASVLIAHMRNDSAVEFLASTHASSQLEKLDCIRSVCQCLVALRTHLSRSLQRIVPLPVLLARGLFHQHERFILKASHQIMCHCDAAPRSIICRIIIPRYNIHLFRPFKVIKPIESSHQIGCNKCIRLHTTDRIALHLEALQLTVRIESAIINGYSCKSRLLGSDSVA